MFNEFSYPINMVDNWIKYCPFSLYYFWLIQFWVTQVEQSSYMFERLSYEISSNQLMMKINNKQGMPIKWELLKSKNS